MNFKFSLVFFTLILSSFHAQAFERIITLSPMVAEWTTLILGEELAKSKIVGTSEYSHYPEILKSVETIGPYHQLKVEKIASLKPDLVLGSEEYNLTPQLEQLKRLKLNVVILKKEEFKNLELWLRVLGEKLKMPKEAKIQMDVWAKAFSELKLLRSKHQKRKCLIEVQHEPLVVVGGSGFLNEAFAMVGCENAFFDLKQGYPKVSKESVLTRNPEQIYILSLTGKVDDFQTEKKDWEKLVDINAVKKQKIQVLSGDDFARCSLRLLKALKQLD